MKNIYQSNNFFFSMCNNEIINNFFCINLSGNKLLSQDVFVENEK